MAAHGPTRPPEDSLFFIGFATIPAPDEPNYVGTHKTLEDQRVLSDKVRRFGHHATPAVRVPVVFEHTPSDVHGHVLMTWTSSGTRLGVLGYVRPRGALAEDIRSGKRLGLSFKMNYAYSQNDDRMVIKDVIHLGVVADPCWGPEGTYIQKVATPRCAIDAIFLREYMPSALYLNAEDRREYLQNATAIFAKNNDLASDGNRLHTPHAETQPRPPYFVWYTGYSKDAAIMNTADPQLKQTPEQAADTLNKEAAPAPATPTTPQPATGKRTAEEAQNFSTDELFQAALRQFGDKKPSADLIARAIKMAAEVKSAEELDDMRRKADERDAMVRKQEEEREKKARDERQETVTKLWSTVFTPVLHKEKDRDMILRLNGISNSMLKGTPVSAEDSNYLAFATTACYARAQDQRAAEEKFQDERRKAADNIMKSASSATPAAAPAAAAAVKTEAGDDDFDFFSTTASRGPQPIAKPAAAPPAAGTPAPAAAGTPADKKDDIVLGPREAREAFSGDVSRFMMRDSTHMFSAAATMSYKEPLRGGSDVYIRKMVHMTQEVAPGVTIGICN